MVAVVVVLGMQGNVDERKGSDRFRRRGGKGGEPRWKQEGKQRQGTQQVFAARLPPLAAASQPGGRTTQLPPRRPDK